MSHSILSSLFIVCIIWIGLRRRVCRSVCVRVELLSRDESVVDVLCCILELVLDDVAVVYDGFIVSEFENSGFPFVPVPGGHQ